MSRSGRELLERALKLPQAERAKLAHEILDSVDEEYLGDIEVDPDYLAELEKRALDEPRPGEKWPTASEVVAEIRRERKKSSRRSKKRA